MKELKIHFLNTIWSDAIILENNNHFAFIDTASDFYYPMIKNHLKQHNIIDIDFILLTHFHGDHFGAFSSSLPVSANGTYRMKRHIICRKLAISGSN